MKRAKVVSISRHARGARFTASGVCGISVDGHGARNDELVIQIAPFWSRAVSAGSLAVGLLLGCGWFLVR
jgi:hypothetical protein